VRLGFPVRRGGRGPIENGPAADQGDEATRFKALAVPHLNEVYTLARYLLPREADAEDAVQECYLRALRYFDTFGGSDIKPWLLAILRNVCRSLGSANKSLVFSEPQDADDAAEEISPLWSEMAETPESAVIRRHNAMTLRQLIEDLPAEFREVIVLREVNDLSYREIAQVIDAPIGTVMSRLARARSLLRDAWITKEGGR
jgi:RNA polymerase sigma-70 factor, ECF subfamily